MAVQKQNAPALTHPQWIGRELGRELAVAPRTVRQDVLTMSMNSPSSLDLAFWEMRFQPIPQTHLLHSGPHDKVDLRSLSNGPTKLIVSH